MKKIPRTTNQLMRKTQLRQIIRESINEVINEGMLDSIIKGFDNLDDFTDKIIAKNPDFVEKTLEKLKETGGNVVDTLKPAADEGLALIKEKNTPENRAKMESWWNKNKGKLIKGGAIYYIYSLVENIIPDMILNIAGIIPELLILVLACYIVNFIARIIKTPGEFIKKAAKGGRELLGLDENEQKIDFNMPLDLTGLSNFVTPEQQN